MRKKTRQRISTSVLVMMIVPIFFAGKPEHSSAQELPKSDAYIICCNLPVNVPATADHKLGTDHSKGRCAKEMGENPSGRQSICDQLKPFMTDGIFCETVAAYCTPKCDPDPYPEYLRKRQASLELFKHASDLRLTASKLVAERLGAESDNLRIEAEKDYIGDRGWENFGRHVNRGMGTSRSALSKTWLARQAAANAPFAVKSWNAIGWIDLAVQTTYRGLVTAGDWSDYQKEAQEATKQAEEMWRKALADLEASLKQAPACLEASRKAAEDEKNLDRAKAAIEKWDNNQNLYWDPIRNEAVTYREALKRADTYLKSGKISQIFHKAVFRPLIFIAEDDPSQQALAAAIRELDKAILSFGRLNGSVTKYLNAQRSIERELEAAFGGKTYTVSEPFIPMVSPKKRVGWLNAKWLTHPAACS